MLPNSYQDRFQQMMSLKLVGLRKESADKYFKASADAARRGKVSPASTAGLRNQLDVHLVEKSITAVVELQRELISGLEIPFCDTLATELKHQVKAYVSTDWCEELHKMNIHGISKKYADRLKEELSVNRDFFLKRAEAQIDCFVDTLRIKQRG